MRGSGRLSRLRRQPSRPTVILLGAAGAAVVATIIVVGAFILFGLTAVDEADPEKARREVQSYYDERFGSRIEVTGCEYTPLGDSDYDTFTCRIRVACPDPVVVSVPRAGELRSDADVSTGEPLPPRCRIERARG